MTPSTMTADRPARQAKYGVAPCIAQVVPRRTCGSASLLGVGFAVCAQLLRGRSREPSCRHRLLTRWPPLDAVGSETGSGACRRRRRRPPAAATRAGTSEAGTARAVPHPSPSRHPRPQPRRSRRSRRPRRPPPPKKARRRQEGPGEEGAAPTWVDPEGRICPPSHPVKAKLVEQASSTCRAMFAYDRTKPDRCYAVGRRRRGRRPPPRQALTVSSLDERARTAMPSARADRVATLVGHRLAWWRAPAWRRAPSGSARGACRRC